MFFSFFRLRGLLNVSQGDKIASCHTRKRYEVTDIGIMHPEEIPTQNLNPGQVGFIACGMKQSSEGLSRTLPWLCYLTFGIIAHIGDTLHRLGSEVEPLAGFQPAKAMVSLSYWGSWCF